MRFVNSTIFALCAALIASSSTAYADGKRDLADGIAFYENLDVDRAVQRLESALESGDLGFEDRAQAYLYLGIVKFELGEADAANDAWRGAFELDLALKVPEGTSPTTVEALEKQRKVVEATPVQTKPKKDEAKPPPKLEVQPPATDVVTQPDTTDDGPNWVLWGSIGVGVVAVAVVVGILAASGGGSECEGAGGCAAIAFQ